MKKVPNVNVITIVMFVVLIGCGCVMDDKNNSKVPSYDATDTGDPVLFYDTFVNNENNWKIWPNGPYYITDISNSTFIMETLNELNSAEFTPTPIAWTENFDVEVSTTWKKGVVDRAYGIAIGSDRQNRYNFGVSGNGWSFVSGYTNNLVIVPSPMPWKSGTALISDGNNKNVLLIEARGLNYHFFVNNIFVGTVVIPMAHDQLKLGLFVENKQRVYFNNLKVTDKM